MKEINDVSEITSKVLLHLYNSVVVGSINSIALMLRIKGAVGATNPAREDLKRLYESLGPELRDVFYHAAASIAEFAVFGVLDFLEQYNRFDSETNAGAFPRLSLTYTDVASERESRLELSQFGSRKLGKEFRAISRNDEIRRLVDSAIEQLLIDASPEDS